MIPKEEGGAKAMSPQMTAVRVAARDGRVSPESLAAERGKKTLGPMHRSLAAAVKAGLLRKIGTDYVATNKGRRQLNGANGTKRKRGRPKKNRDPMDSSPPSAAFTRGAWSSGPPPSAQPSELSDALPKNEESCLIAACFFESLARSLRSCAAP